MQKSYLRMEHLLKQSVRELEVVKCKVQKWNHNHNHNQLNGGISSIN